MSSSSILVVEADEQQRQELKAILEFLDYDMVHVTDCVNWRQSLEDASVHLQSCWVGAHPMMAL